METHRRYDFRKQHYAGEEGRLIPLLQQAQTQDGYITRARMEEIHQQTGVPVTAIFGVATFYAQFRLKPVGKYLIRVCHGTACHVSGANDITEAVSDQLGVPDGETTPDRLFTLETVACLGCCSLAPVITVGTTTHGNLDPREVKKVVQKVQKAEKAKAPEAKKEGAS
jgi:NADH-quinone oxidoreductase subunit E